MKLNVSHKKSRITRFIVWAVLLVFLVAVGVFTVLYLNQDKVATPSAERQQPLVKPEEKVVEQEQFSDLPSRLRIPSLSIEAPIMSVGLTSTGQMDVPATLVDVGWYNRSARVGADSKYSVLVDGHYGTDKRPGIFYNLHKITKDAVIEVEGNSGKVAKYKVVEIERRRLEEVDMKKAFNVYSGAKQSITLITCEGEYDTARATYNDRIVVYAVRA